MTASSPAHVTSWLPATLAGRSSERVSRPRRAAPADTVRPTRAEVNLGAIRHNFHEVRKTAQGSAVYAVLKADGYGHGAPAIARTLERAGVYGFAVALLEEALELRHAGIQKPILVMGGYYGQAWSELLQENITPVVYDASQIESIAREVRYRDSEPIGIHLKLDTGMARLGVRGPELRSVLHALHTFPQVKLDGLMTHLACADAPDPSATQEQLQQFESLTSQIRTAGFTARVRHAANSAAVFQHTAAARFELVRPGIALFGVSPCSTPAGVHLKPAMRIRSEVVALRDLKPGEAVGYGWSWRATKATKIATIPIGYADGLPRALSNCGHLLLRGKRAPIVGTVSMDMVMVDVTDIIGVCIRDEAVALGAQEGPLGKAYISAEEIAQHASTIPWEILTNISRRVPRFYREP